MLEAGIEEVLTDVGNDTLYYVAWDEQAHEVGILHLYSVSDRESLARWQRHAMNYGPVFAYYVWAQNELRRAVLSPFRTARIVAACGSLLRHRKYG